MHPRRAALPAAATLALTATIAGGAVANAAHYTPKLSWTFHDPTLTAHPWSQSAWGGAQGNVTNVPRTAQAYLQRSSGKRWVTASKVNLTNGWFWASTGEVPVGTHTYRVVITSRSGRTLATTSTRRLSVAAPPQKMAFTAGTNRVASPVTKYAEVPFAGTLTKVGTAQNVYAQKWGPKGWEWAGSGTATGAKFAGVANLTPGRYTLRTVAVDKAGRGLVVSTTNRVAVVLPSPQRLAVTVPAKVTPKPGDPTATVPVRAAVIKAPTAAFSLVQEKDGTSWVTLPPPRPVVTAGTTVTGAVELKPGRREIRVIVYDTAWKPLIISDPVTTTVAPTPPAVRWPAPTAKVSAALSTNTGAATLKGTVLAAPTATTVTVQRLTGSTWTTLVKAPVSKGAFTATTGQLGLGTHQLRATATDKAGKAIATSAALALDVDPANGYAAPTVKFASFTCARISDTQVDVTARFTATGGRYLDLGSPEALLAKPAAVGGGASRTLATVIPMLSWDSARLSLQGRHTLRPVRVLAPVGADVADPTTWVDVHATGTADLTGCGQ